MSQTERHHADLFKKGVRVQVTRINKGLEPEMKKLTKDNIRLMRRTANARGVVTGCHFFYHEFIYVHQDDGEAIYSWQELELI